MIAPLINLCLKAMSIALREWPPLMAHMRKNKSGWYQLLGPDGEPIFPGAWSGLIEPGMEITLVYRDELLPEDQEINSWLHITYTVYVKNPQDLESTDVSDREWITREMEANERKSDSDSDSDSDGDGDSNGRSLASN